MYMADQTARLCAGQSHENTDYYRTIALIEQRATSRECRVLIKCGLGQNISGLGIPLLDVRIKMSAKKNSYSIWSWLTFANG